MKPQDNLDKDPPQNVAAEKGSESKIDDRGSKARPLFVEPVFAPKSEKEAAEDQEGRDEKSSADLWMVRLTGALVLVGAMQGLVFWVQARRLKATITKMDDIATQQTVDMKLQTRAYLSVSHMVTVPQNPFTNFKTEVRLSLINAGRTPAHGVHYEANCAVVDFPVPDYFDFPIPKPPNISMTVLGPGQTSGITTFLPHIMGEEDIALYTKGDVKRVCAWGIVHYTDAFGHPHTTKFAQTTVWLVGGGNFAVNTRQHNEAD